MRKLLLLLFILASLTVSAQPVKFRSGIFLHHSTGACIWGPNGSTTSVPNEINNYNTQHGYTGDNAVTLNEQGWPDNPWENEWVRWHNIFEGLDATADITPFYSSNKIIIIKSCFPSSSMSGGWGSPADTLDPTIKSVYNYKWHWRTILRIMRQHPDNFFVIWTNAPLVANATNTDEAYYSSQFCRWAKDTLGLGLDQDFGVFPANAYVFDFFHNLADNTNCLPLQYAASETDSHPNAAATELIAPIFVNELFDASIAYESAYNILIPPVPVFPANGANGLLPAITLNWSDVPNAITYTLQISSVSDFSTLITEQSSLTVSESTLPDGLLSYNIQYFWRVKALNEFTQSVWSQVFSFSTCLPIPLLLFPTNATTNLPTTVPFAWMPSDGAESYSIQLSTNENFTNIADESTGITSSYYMSPLLDPQTTYYWHVRSVYTNGESPWSDVWYFTTAESMFITVGTGTAFNLPWAYPAPYGNYHWGSKHQILVHADELTSQGIGTGIILGLGFTVASTNFIDTLDNFTIKMKLTTAASLTTSLDTTGWTTVYTSTRYGVMSLLNIHLFSSPFPWDGTSNILIETCFNNSSTSFNASMFHTATPFTSVAYYRANNSSVCESATATSTSSQRPNLTFAILQIPELNSPTLIEPVFLATDVSINPSMKWTQIGGATSYQLQLSKEASFAVLDFDVTGITDTTHSLTGLDYGTLYYWRVRGVNNENGSWSIPFAFTTITSGTDVQVIYLTTGWNQISSYITPNDPDLLAIMSDIFDKIRIMKNGSGEIFIPQQGINTIGVWNPNDGYQIDMTQPAALTITGNKILPEMNPITLNQGWNLVSYFRENGMPPDQALISISNNLVIAKDGLGNFYCPGFNVNALDQMQPGFGYWIYVNNQSYLLYPGN
jgi:hypothetical protein